MKKTFQCEICGKEFGESEACADHEILCLFNQVPENIRSKYLKSAHNLVSMAREIENYVSFRYDPFGRKLTDAVDRLRRFQALIMFEGRHNTNEEDCT